MYFYCRQSDSHPSLWLQSTCNIKDVVSLPTKYQLNQHYYLFHLLHSVFRFVSFRFSSLQLQVGECVCMCMCICSCLFNFFLVFFCHRLIIVFVHCEIFLLHFYVRFDANLIHPSSCDSHQREKKKEGKMESAKHDTL